MKKNKFKKLDISKIKDLDQVATKDVDWVFHLAGIADIVPVFKILINILCQTF